MRLIVLLGALVVALAFAAQASAGFSDGNGKPMEVVSYFDQ
jgi:hypothetical protein